MGKIILIFLKLNFFPNTLGCYGLSKVPLREVSGKVIVRSYRKFGCVQMRLRGIYSGG